MATITESNTRRTDPSIWKPPQFDREERWVNPSIVGNVLKEVSETTNTAAGGTLAIGSFMSGRVVFNGAASGTKTLPTATDIVTYLEANYSQLTGRVASATGVTPKVKEIEVEFFNNTAAAAITIQGNTGITLTPTTVSIPAASSAKYKFIIEQTTPVPTITGVLAIGVSQYANNISPTIIIPGTTAFGLSAAAPDQLVVFDTATQTLGYVTNALLQATDVNDNFMGWDTATSTPSKNPVLATAPHQLFTRDTTTGAIYNSAYGVIPFGTTADYAPLSVEISTGNVVKTPNTGITWRNKNGEAGPGQTITTGTDTVVTYTFQSGIGTFTYAAGVFTATDNGLFHFDVTCSTDIVAANSYFHLQVDGVDFAGTGYMGSQTTATISAARSLVVGQQIQVLFNNTSGGDVVLISGLPISNDFKAVRVGP